MVEAVAECSRSTAWRWPAARATGPRPWPSSRLQPEVAIVDLRMPGCPGSRSRGTCADRPATAVILYTAFGDRALLTEALDAGAGGSCSRRRRWQRSCVRRARRAGRTYVDPVLAGVLSSSAATEKMTNLTQRERDVLRLLADGISNEEIGKELFISPETVRTHVRKAMAKLEADTRTQAVATALRQSLIA